MTTAVEVRHGYSLRDLDHLTRYVVVADRWHRAADVEDRFDAVWHALAEHLLTAAEPPTRGEMFRVGIAASDRAVQQTLQSHGYNPRQPGTRRPRFDRYWMLVSAPTASPEGHIVEHLALQQIWPRLAPRQQEALTALAVTGDYRQAAEALGVTQGTFHTTVSKARARFLTWWHEGEQRSRVWGTDRRVGSRSATAPATTRRRPVTRAAARRTGRPVHKLRHGTVSTYTNHGCRCGPCTQAATTAARAGRRRAGTQPRRRITVAPLVDVRARREQGETLVRIAGDYGVSDSYLSRVLSGKLTPAQDLS